MKTNKKYFEIFKKECQYWIDFFGLTDYRIEFFMSEEINGARGQTEDYKDLMALDITFPTELHDETGIEKIKKTAFHEVCEGMLMRVREMANQHYNWELVNKEIHTTIRRLENSIYKNN